MRYERDGMQPLIIGETAVDHGTSAVTGDVEQDWCRSIQSHWVVLQGLDCHKGQHVYRVCIGLRMEMDRIWNGEVGMV